MRRAEGIVLALVALGEAVETAALADRADALAAACQNLVGVGLVADVPDQPVTWRVEDIVERHGEFDDAHAAAEMAAGLRGGGDHLITQFLGKAGQVGRAKLPHGLRSRGTVKERCQLVHTHDCNT